MSEAYDGRLGGLCGNMNGNHDDDLWSRDVPTPGVSPTDFGDSWVFPTVGQSMEQ